MIDPTDGEASLQKLIETAENLETNDFLYP
jgi:hypothetical protein